MKHLLNNLSEEEKNSIREQHEGGMKLDTSRFRTLLENKSGNVKPLVEQHDDFEDDFSAVQMAEKLKLQLRKLEAIRFLSDKLVSQKQLGRDIFIKGIREGIKKLSTSKYAVSLYELIKAYAEIKRKQNFSIMNISKLPVYTMEEAIKKITSLLKDLTEWRDIKDLVPGSFSGSRNLKKSGLAGTFAGSLELVREGKLSIMQKKIFDKILIKSR